MKTLGSSKRSVLSRLLAAITLAAIASSATAGPVEQCRWDELSHKLVAAEHEMTQIQDTTVADDAWLPRPTHSAAIRSQPGDSADSTFHAFAVSEQTLIPLPAAEWSGLVGLVGLALVRARKSLRKMFM
jgi:hypothetical protein